MSKIYATGICAICANQQKVQPTLDPTILAEKIKVYQRVECTGGCEMIAIAMDQGRPAVYYQKSLLSNGCFTMSKFENWSYKLQVAGLKKSADEQRASFK